MVISFPAETCRDCRIVEGLSLGCEAHCRTLPQPSADPGRAGRLSLAAARLLPQAHSFERTNRAGTVPSLVPPLRGMCDVLPGSSARLGALPLAEKMGDVGRGLNLERVASRGETYGEPAAPACRCASCAALIWARVYSERVCREVAAVLPEVAPNPENALERLADHARREGFKGDRPVVPSAHQRPKHGLQIDGARAHVASVQVPGVEVPEIVARLDDGLRRIGFLDVHVVDVEMRLDVRRSDPATHLHGLRRGVEHVRIRSGSPPRDRA